MSLSQWAVATALAAGLALAPQPGFARDQAREQTVEGMSRERLARIAEVMQREIGKNTVPGAVTLIARNGRIVHFEAHGFLDAGKTRPMQKDSIFRIASMTKPIVTTAAMMMIERGLFLLRDPIAQYLPELKDLKVETRKADGSYEDVPAARQPTVHDLLRHTAGFTYGFGGARSDRLRQLYGEADVEGVKAEILRDEAVKRLGTLPLAFNPATTFEYGINIDVLGWIMERVAGKPLGQIVEELVLRPLGMKDTSFWVPPEKQGRLADALDSDPNKKWVWDWIRITSNPDGKRYEMGGGGMASTAEDYFRFSQMILNGGELNGVRLLSEKTVDFMLSDHIIGMAGSTAGSAGPGYGFGLGFAVRQHDGMAVVPGSKGDAMWAGITGVSFTIDPTERLVGVFMSQGPTSRVHTRMLFKNLIYGAMVRSRANGS